MKKYLPTLILGLLALAAVAGLFIYLDTRPETTVGDSQSEEHLLAMELSNDGSYYIITGIGSLEETDIIIPSEYKGVPVKEIGQWAFRYNSEINSVTIPDTVEIIRESAFSHTSISEIIIPNSVTALEGYVFSGCQNLEKAVLPENIAEIGENLFSECSKLKDVNIPKSIVSIPANCFSQCISLKNISLPDGIQTLGNSAFMNCNALESINLPDSLKIISDSCFWGSRLAEVNLPSGLEEIGGMAFEDCPIKSVSLPKGLKKLGNRAFGRTEISSVEIPASVTEIGANPYSGCKNLTRITVSNENPVYYSQNNCIISKDDYSLISFASIDDIPNDGSIKIIGMYAYSDIDADTVVIPEGVKVIKSSAIVNFDNIGEIVLPKSLELIEEGAISAVNYHNESVKKITYCGTSEQWHSMNRAEKWLSSADNVLIIDIGAK